MHDDPSIKQLRRSKRWRRRHAAQRVADRQAALNGGWLPGRFRLAGCGRWTHANAEGVELRVRSGDDTYAYYAGLQTCGSVWACPVCSAKIRARRSIEVAAAAAIWTNGGGKLGMLTLTVRHHRRHSLTALLDGLRESWRVVQRSEDWRRFRQKVGGTITALEVTVGPNGWHPHLHVLVLLEADAKTDFVEETVGHLWRSAVASRLDVAPTLGHGTHWLPMDDANAAAYVAKVADEVTRSDLKGDAGSPWALLDQIGGALDGEAEAVEAFARWSEYVDAMRGRRAVVWSNGLRSKLGLGPAKKDAELAAADEGGDLVRTIDPREWARLRSTYDDRGRLLAVALLDVTEVLQIAGEPLLV